MHHITKSLFVGAAIISTGMLSGKAEIIISDAMRSKLEITIEEHLTGLYQRINGEFPGSLDDKSLKEDRDKIMMSLLDNIDGLPWGVPTFYGVLCSNILDFNFSRCHAYLENPVTFTQDYFEENFAPRRVACSGIEETTVDLKFTRVLDRLYGAVFFPVQCGCDEKESIEKCKGLLKAGFIEEDTRGYRKKPHVVFGETFIQQLLDLYIPEAVKNFSPLIGFHYSMYLFFDKTIPSHMDPVVYFLAKRVFEVDCRCNYLKRRFGLDSKETFEGFKRLQEMFPRFIKVLRGCNGGRVCRADSIFPDGIKGFSSERREKYEKTAKEHRIFVYCLLQKAQKLQRKIDYFLAKK